MTTALAAWSNHLFGVTLVLYTLGMLAFAIDLAFGQRRQVAATAVRPAAVEIGRAHV